MAVRVSETGGCSRLGGFLALALAVERFKTTTGWAVHFTRTRDRTCRAAVTLDVGWLAYDTSAQ